MNFSQARFNLINLTLQLGMGFLFDKAKKSFFQENNSVINPVQNNYNNQMIDYYNNNMEALYNYQQPQYQYNQTFI